LPFSLILFSFFWLWRAISRNSYDKNQRGKEKTMNVRDGREKVETKGSADRQGYKKY
jgi:hypothetical protein